MQQENGKLFGIFTASTLFSCSSSSLVRPPSSGTFLKFCKTFIVKCGKGLVHFKRRLDREEEEEEELYLIEKNIFDKYVWTIYWMNYIWLRKTPAVPQPLRDLASKTSQQLRQPRFVFIYGCNILQTHLHLYMTNCTSFGWWERQRQRQRRRRRQRQRQGTKARKRSSPAAPAAPSLIRASAWPRTAITCWWRCL